MGVVVVCLHIDRSLELDQLTEAISTACRGVLLCFGRRTRIVLLGTEAHGKALWDIVIAWTRDKRAQKRLSLVAFFICLLWICFRAELIEYVATSIVLFNFSTLSSQLDWSRLWCSNHLRIVVIKEDFMSLN